MLKLHRWKVIFISIVMPIQWFRHHLVLIMSSWWLITCFGYTLEWFWDGRPHITSCQVMSKSPGYAKTHHWNKSLPLFLQDCYWIMQKTTNKHTAHFLTNDSAAGTTSPDPNLLTVIGDISGITNNPVCPFRETAQSGYTSGLRSMPLKPWSSRAQFPTVLILSPGRNLESAHSLPARASGTLPPRTSRHSMFGWILLLTDRALFYFDTVMACSPFLPLTRSHLMYFYFFPSSQHPLLSAAQYFVLPFKLLTGK